VTSDVGRKFASFRTYKVFRSCMRASVRVRARMYARSYVRRPFRCREGSRPFESGRARLESQWRQCRLFSSPPRIRYHGILACMYNAKLSFAVRDNSYVSNCWFYVWLQAACDVRAFHAKAVPDAPTVTRTRCKSFCFRIIIYERFL